MATPYILIIYAARPPLSSGRAASCRRTHTCPQSFCCIMFLLVQIIVHALAPGSYAFNSCDRARIQVSSIPDGVPVPPTSLCQLAISEDSKCVVVTSVSKYDGIRAFESYQVRSLACSGTQTVYGALGRAAVLLLLGTCPECSPYNSPSGTTHFDETRTGRTLPRSSNAPSSYIDAAGRQGTVRVRSQT